jgi:hypothetical protein
VDACVWDLSVTLGSEFFAEEGWELEVKNEIQEYCSRMY